MVIVIVITATGNSSRSTKSLIAVKWPQRVDVTALKRPGAIRVLPEAKYPVRLGAGSVHKDKLALTRAFKHTAPGGLEVQSRTIRPQTTVQKEAGFGSVPRKIIQEKFSLQFRPCRALKHVILSVVAVHSSAFSLLCC